MELIDGMIGRLLAPELKDLIRRREVGAGFLMGCALGALGVARILVWQFPGFKDHGPHYALLAFTIGGSLIGVVLWGSLIGAMLPIFLRRCRLDPATCSAPFVATLGDVTGIVIYFTVAFHLLHGTLQLNQAVC